MERRWIRFGPGPPTGGSPIVSFAAAFEVLAKTNDYHLSSFPASLSAEEKTEGLGCPSAAPRYCGRSGC
jgi:hypothetical protein